MILENKYQIRINLKKIIRIKNKYGLKTQIRKKNKYNVFRKEQFENRVSANILNRQFKQEQPDKVYSTDISYLFYHKGQKAYLSATKDLATKEIVCFTVSRGMSVNMAYSGIENILKKLEKEKRKNLIIHSDQGLHYTNQYYVHKPKRIWCNSIYV